ncbi:MAG: very short patch repair endonuclease [Halieaceae bacterium]
MPGMSRSRQMSRIRSKNTRPEILVRKLLHQAGFRFRIHYTKLPGKPDIVLPKYRAVIRVNGCFWHGHDCHIFHWPKTRREFWERKINANVVRDKSYKLVYSKAGWKTLTIWECAVQGKTKLPLQSLMKNIENWILYDTQDAAIEGFTEY